MIDGIYFLSNLVGVNLFSKRMISNFFVLGVAWSLDKCKAVLCEISAETSGIPQYYVIIIFVVAGAAVALFCTMHTKEQLGGCIALSTMLPEKLPGFPDPSSIVNKGQDTITVFLILTVPHHITCLIADIPYFQAHGESDNILPLSHGIATSKNLKKFLPNHQVKQA